MLLYGLCTFVLLMGLLAFESSAPPPKSIHWIGIAIYANAVVWLVSMSVIARLPLWISIPGSMTLVIGIVWRISKLTSIPKTGNRR